jgi:hypothetical protein
MTNKGLTRLAVFLTLLLIFVMWFIVGQFGKNFRTAYEAVPESAALVLETDNIGLSWKKLTSEPGIWSSLGKHDYFRRAGMQISLLDSIFSTKPELRSKLAESRALLILLESEGEYGLLFVAETGRSLHALDLVEISERHFGNSITLVKRKYRDYNTYLALDATTGLQYDFCITDGLLIGSFSKKLLEKGLDQLQSGKSLLENQLFARLRGTCSSSVDSYLLANLHNLGKLFNSLTLTRADSILINTFNSIGGWMALDLYLNEHSVILNGYAGVEDGAGSFLSKIAGKEGHVPGIYSVLPSNTVGLMHTSAALFSSHYEAVDASGSKDSMAWAREPFLSLLDTEISLLRMNLDDRSVPVYVFRCQDQLQVKEWLSLHGFIQGNPEQIADGLVHQMNNIGFFKSFFSSNLFTNTSGWGVTSGTYYFFSDSKEALDFIVRLQGQDRTLASSDNFRQFANHLTDQSNLILYMNVRESSEIVRRFLTASVAGNLGIGKGLLNDFGGLSLQLSGLKDLIYVSIHLQHNPDYKEESLIEWKADLESTAVGKPRILTNPKTDEYVVVIQDVNNKIYLFSNNGKLIRKFQADGAVLGDVVAVQAGNQEDFAIMFNTTGQIFMLDLNGRPYPGFPIQLNPQATAGVTVVFDKDWADYQIVVPCTDQAVHSFSFRGRQSPDWQFPRTNDIMVVPVEHLVVGGRDYLMLTDINSDIRVADRSGNIRMSQKGSVERSVNSSFYLNKTNSKGIIISTDKSGKLFYINSNGLISTTDFGDFSPDHYFLYEDFSLNNAADFMFIDGNRLIVFDRFKSKVYEQQFAFAVNTKPYFLNIGSKRYLVIYPDQSENIYLISNNDRILLDAALAQGNPFDIGTFGRTSRIIMLTYSGKEVYCYRMN